MKNEINYEEDLFLLKGLIKYWTESVMIPADVTFFSEKLMEDLDFIDVILTKLLTTLQANGNLIHKGEILHQMLTTKTVFSHLLTAILKFDTPIKEALHGTEDQITSMLRAQKTEIETIAKRIRTLVGDEEPEEDLITPTEMEFLLQKDPEE